MDSALTAHLRGIEDQLQKSAHRAVNKETKTMLNGTVKFYNEHRGYGFVVRDDGQGDVYLHARALERAGIKSVEDGDKVEFDIGTHKTAPKSATLSSPN